MDEKTAADGQRRASVRNLEATRQAILDATIAQLDEVGASSVRVAAVARTAGITTGAIYNIFKGREELIAAAQAQIMIAMVDAANRMQHQIEENFDGNRILSPEYREVMRTVFSPPNKRQRLQWAAIVARAHQNEKLSDLIEPTEQKAADAIVAEARYSQKQGWLRDDLDARAIATIMLGATIGVSIAGRVYEDVEGFDDKILEAWMYLARAFVPEAQV